MIDWIHPIVIASPSLRSRVKSAKQSRLSWAEKSEIALLRSQ